MTTRYKYASDVPYSLHDMSVSKIEAEEDRLKLHFEYGYVLIAEPCVQVMGNIVIEKTDYDFCFAYLLSRNGEFGAFQGEKLSLLDFLDRYADISFEIVDESYGYNTVVYNGYLGLPNKAGLIELTLTIYHFGDIVYETEQ